MNILRTSDGALCGFGEIAIDITYRNRAEQERLQQHAERDQRWQEDEKIYRALKGCLSSHIAVLDRTGKIIMVNDAWNRFARENEAPSEAAVGVGANYLDVCRRAASDCEDAARALAGLEATISGLHAEFTFEYPCHSPGVQRWFNLCATPWPVDGGAVVSHSDITQRVLAEKKLQDSEQHYRAMIENEVDIVTILDKSVTSCIESPALSGFSVTARTSWWEKMYSTSSTLLILQRCSRLSRRCSLAWNLQSLSSFGSDMRIQVIGLSKVLLAICWQIPASKESS